MDNFEIECKSYKVGFTYFDFSFPISTQGFSAKKFRLDAIVGLSCIFWGKKIVIRSGMIYYIRQVLLLW